MLILSRVAVEFKDRQGNTIFAVPDKMRNLFIEAPDAITQDPYFHLMLSDGTLEAGVERAKMRQIEQDPTAGHDAAGNLILPDTAETSTEPTRKTRKGKEGNTSFSAASPSASAESGDPK